MPELTTIQHPNPATTRAMIAELNTARAADDTPLIGMAADNIRRAVDAALEPMGLTFHQLQELGL